MLNYPSPFPLILHVPRLVQMRKTVCKKIETERGKERERERDRERERETERERKRRERERERGKERERERGKERERERERRRERETAERERERERERGGGGFASFISLMCGVCGFSYSCENSQRLALDHSETPSWLQVYRG